MTALDFEMTQESRSKVRDANHDNRMTRIMRASIQNLREPPSLLTKERGPLSLMRKRAAPFSYLREIRFYLQGQG